jgi:hypothetical protein
VTDAANEGATGDVAVGSNDVGADVVAEEASESMPTEVVLDSGDAALTLEEAGVLAAELGATIIVVAGAQAVGKTTMAVTLWGQFLHGAFAEFRFAGSRSLDAFDQRQFAARLSSGNAHPETRRTEDEDLRLLHLRIATPDGALADLMPSDIKGEFFEDVINGRAVVPGLQELVARADKVVVAIDGAKIASLVDRASATFEAEQLIGGLTEPGWVHPDAPVLVLLTKHDLVCELETEAWYDGEADRLVTFAQRRGLTAVSSAKVRARPIAAGFEDLLRWMHAPVHRGTTIPADEPPTIRVFAAGVMA